MSGRVYVTVNRSEATNLQVGMRKVLQTPGVKVKFPVTYGEEGGIADIGEVALLVKTAPSTIVSGATVGPSNDPIVALMLAQGCAVPQGAGLLCFKIGGKNYVIAPEYYNEYIAMPTVSAPTTNTTGFLFPAIPTWPEALLSWTLQSATGATGTGTSGNAQTLPLTIPHRPAPDIYVLAAQYTQTNYTNGPINAWLVGTLGMVTVNYPPGAYTRPLVLTVTKHVAALGSLQYTLNNGMSWLAVPTNNQINVTTAGTINLRFRGTASGITYPSAAVPAIISNPTGTYFVLPETHTYTVS